MKKTKLTRSLMAAVSIVALSAVMYGCVHSGSDAPQMEAPDLSMQIGGASAAAMAAATAASDAATAVAGVASMSTADPASYIEARDAAAAAMAASNAAAAASAEAAAADTEEDADAALARAEAEQAKAAAALANAQMYAGMVTAAQEALDQAAEAAAEAERLAAEAAAEAERLAAEAAAEAERLAALAAEAERMALTDARTEADTAADAAEMSADDAEDAVAAVMDMAGYAQSSYDTAQEKAEDARAAATAARDASDAATRAATSAEAATHQATAETKQGEAATALADAMMYAGMVTQAKIDADAEAQRLADEAAAEAAAATALADAKGEAQDAHDAAEMAKDDAQAAVDAVMDGMDLNASTMAAFERAEAAAGRANAAYLDAVTANVAAQAAMSADDADPHVKAAKAAQAAAETASDQAEVLAGIVQAAIDAKTAADALAAAEAAEAEALADAKMKAGEAATAARTAATAADEAANAAEAAAPGSTAATDARNAATAADEAATAAEAANMAAQAAMDSGAAMTAQAEAERQQGVAEGRRDVAVSNQNSAEDARAAAEQLQEERDLAEAQQAAEDLYNDAADGVLFHYNAVVGKAGDAADKADEADASAKRAERARTDATTANEEADKAKAASDEAQASLERADLAKADADAALAAAQNAELSAEAEEALADLQVANAALTEEHTGDTGAGMDYMAAKAAAEAAATAADLHVIRLFTMANARHITTALDPDANADEDESTLIENRRLAHVSNVHDAIAAEANDHADDGTLPDPIVTPNAAGTTLTTAMATWPHSATVAEADAVEDTERDGQLTVTVNIDGTAIATTRDDAATADTDETNFGGAQGGGLGDFTHGIDMSSAGTRILLFTDKEQATAPVDADTISYTNEPITSHVGVMPEAAPAGQGEENAGDFGGTYDPDGDGPIPTLTGTFDCVDPTTCRITRTGTGNAGEHIDGQTMVTAISGYTFSGTGTVPLMLSMEDMSYLVFGVWLTETEDTDATDTDMDTVNDYAFGAFHGGGTDGPVHADMEGTATYSGSAAGVHSTATRVDFFDGDATLTADFDASDANHTAEIHGTISNIYSGGVALDGYGDNIIYLDLRDHATANVDTDGAFDGRARLGDPDRRVDREFDYDYEGTWSGEFYNGVQDDGDTADVNEANTTQPGSVAGTFGVRNSDSSESFVGAFGAHKDDN